MGWKKTEHDYKRVYTTVAANLYTRKPAGGSGSRETMPTSCVVMNSATCKNTVLNYCCLAHVGVCCSRLRSTAKTVARKPPTCGSATRHNMTSFDSFETGVRLGQGLELGGIGGRRASSCTCTRACITTCIVQTDGRRKKALLVILGENNNLMRATMRSNEMEKQVTRGTKRWGADDDLQKRAIRSVSQPMRRQ